MADHLGVILMLITCFSLGNSLFETQVVPTYKSTMADHLGVILMLITYFSLGSSLPLPTSKTILVEPDTVKFYASFIHSSATITDTTIQFGAGTDHEEILRVPIAAPGELNPRAMIRITVGMNPPVADNDPTVGITDGINRNQYQLVNDGRSTISLNPCSLRAGTQNGRSAPHGDPVAGTYVMLYDPIHRFGSCSTNNGFATAGKFTDFVDASKGLSLIVHRHNDYELYTFHYFLVEFL